MKSLLFFLLFPCYLNAQQYTVIKKVNVVDVVKGSIIPHQTVLIKDSIIESIGKKIPIPAGAKRIKAKGKYLIPGLIDTHVHLAWDLDSLMYIKTSDRLRLLYLLNGITTIREASTRGLENQTIAARDNISYYPLPRISVSGRVDALRIKKAGLTAAELTKHLIQLGVNSIKIRYGLTIDDIESVIGVAKRHSIPVWGHTYHNGKDYTSEAIEAGVNGVTHVQGIPPLGTNKRTDTLPADDMGMGIYSATNWLFTDSSAIRHLIKKMVEHGVWLEPTLITEDFVVNENLLNKYPLIKRSKAYLQMRQGFPTPKGQDLQQYKAAIIKMKDFVKQFHEAGGVVIAGSDGAPFPGFGIKEELRLLVEAGLSPADALRTATINSAKVLGWEQWLGSIEKGKKADMVLLEGTPLENITNTKKIWGVFVNGNYLSKNDLKKMMKEFEVKIK